MTAPSTRARIFRQPAAWLGTVLFGLSAAIMAGTSPEGPAAVWLSPHVLAPTFITAVRFLWLFCLAYAAIGQSVANGSAWAELVVVGRTSRWVLPRLCAATLVMLTTEALLWFWLGAVAGDVRMAVRGAVYTMLTDVAMFALACAVFAWMRTRLAVAVWLVIMVTGFVAVLFGGTARATTLGRDVLAGWLDVYAMLALLGLACVAGYGVWAAFYRPRTRRFVRLLAPASLVVLAVAWAVAGALPPLRIRIGGPPRLAEPTLRLVHAAVTARARISICPGEDPEFARLWQTATEFVGELTAAGLFVQHSCDDVAKSLALPIAKTRAAGGIGLRVADVVDVVDAWTGYELLEPGNVANDTTELQLRDVQSFFVARLARGLAPRRTVCLTSGNGELELSAAVDVVHAAALVQESALRNLNVVALSLIDPTTLLPCDVLLSLGALSARSNEEILAVQEAQARGLGVVIGLATPPDGGLLPTGFEPLLSNAGLSVVGRVEQERPVMAGATEGDAMSHAAAAWWRPFVLAATPMTNVALQWSEPVIWGDDPRPRPALLSVGRELLDGARIVLVGSAESVHPARGGAASWFADVLLWAAHAAPMLSVGSTNSVLVSAAPKSVAVAVGVWLAFIGVAVFWSRPKRSIR